jgi:hypothetical protein
MEDTYLIMALLLPLQLGVEYLTLNDCERREERLT